MESESETDLCLQPWPANSPQLSEASDGKLLVRVEVRDGQWLVVELRGAGPTAAEEAQPRLSISGESR